MNRGLLRRTATVLTALLLFAHASIALAACAMDRGAMAPVMDLPADTEHDCGDMAADADPAGMCVAHCTADLQLAGGAAVLLRAPARTAVLYVAACPASVLVSKDTFPPPRGVPPRILLHSFLI